MLHAIDLDVDHKTLHPTVPSIKTLQEFVIPPERHDAYMVMWNVLRYVGVVGNTFMWLHL
jgi:hypothetical protein